MNVTLYESTVTEQALQLLEAEGEKYAGLYADMNNADERRYIKDSATEIKSLIKKIEALRVSSNKDFTAQNNSAARELIRRLESANLPLTNLIDGYNAERKLILDTEKAKKEAAALLVQIEIDHGNAIADNKLWEYERIEREQEQREHDAEIAERAAKEATEQAEYDAAVEADRIERKRAAIETDKINAQKAREADVEHKRATNIQAASFFCDHGFSGDDSVKIIKLIAQGRVANVTINY